MHGCDETVYFRVMTVKTKLVEPAWWRIQMMMLHLIYVATYMVNAKPNVAL